MLKMWNSSRILGLTLLVHSCFVNLAMAQGKLGLNDVSWLWPVPTSVADLNRTISMGALKGLDGADVWSDLQFQSLLDVVNSDATEVEGTRIEFDPDFSSKDNWRIAGMRIDPTAPGADPKLIAMFGSSVQIRLIVQPVTVRSSGVRVHDTAVHLVYSFNKGRDPSNPRRNIPDNDKFKAILDDVLHLKAISRAGSAPTEEAPLGVHPGLSKNVPGLGDEVAKFLSKHLTSTNLSAKALAGIQSRFEPWIFFALAPGSNGKFGPIPVVAPFAKPQMIDFRSRVGVVTPIPVVSNRPIPGGAGPTGVSTSDLFDLSLSDLGTLATIGKDSSGASIQDAEVKNADIADVVASPVHSHFFNTDCVSCHTESQRRNILNLPLGRFAFRLGGQSPAIASEVTSRAKWNVRNFGWFPNVLASNATTPTATQRTANETAEVILFINEHFLSD